MNNEHNKALLLDKFPLRSKFAKEMGVMHICYEMDFN